MKNNSNTNRTAAVIILVILILCLFSIGMWINDRRRKRVELPANEKIIGLWILDSTSLPSYKPARIPSFCSNLYSGSRFYFINKKLRVIQKDSTKECFDYPYDIKDNNLSIVEGDMVITLIVKDLTDDNLIIQSRLIPDSFYTNERYLLYLTKKR